MSKRNRGGKPKQKGERFPCGKLRSVVDYGNDKVVDLRLKFRPFQGGKADDQVHDQIGRAWAVGLLDGYGVDAAAIRDAGRNYGARYWGYWPDTPGVANYEGDDRRGGGWGDSEDPRGERFNSLDAAIRSAGRLSHDALHNLCVDFFKFPFDDADWTERLINDRFVEIGRAQYGFRGLPKQSGADHAKLKLAIEGLLTIVAGKQRRAA